MNHYVREAAADFTEKEYYNHSVASLTFFVSFNHCLYEESNASTLGE